MKRIFVTLLLSSSASAVPLTITPQTQTVEPGAQIILTASELVNWSATSGQLGSVQGTSIVFFAPREGGPVTITIQDPKDKTRKAFAAVNVLGTTARNIWPLSTIYAGKNNSFIVGNDGTVWGWGKGSYNQIPASTLEKVLIPQQIEGLEDIKEIGGNINKSNPYYINMIALGKNGNVFEWGGSGIVPEQTAQGINRLGYGNCRALIDPKGILKIENNSFDINATYYTSTWMGSQYPGWYAIDRDGNLYASSQSDCRAGIPKRIPGIKDIISLAEFGEQGSAIAITKDGKGHKISNGQVSDMPGFSDIKMISASNDRGVLLKNDGKAYGFTISYDKLTSLPKLISGADRLVSVSASNTHIMALREDGAVFASGSNEFGQLGNGTTESSDSFIEVVGVRALVP